MSEPSLLYTHLSHSELTLALANALMAGQMAEAAQIAVELDERMHLVFYTDYVAYRASLVAAAA